MTLLHFAEAKDARIKRRHAALGAAIAASERLASAAAALEMGEPQTLAESDRHCARHLLAEISRLRFALPSRTPLSNAVPAETVPAILPGLRELQLAVSTLHDSLSREEPAGTGAAFIPAKRKKPLFVADAFTNPAHVHFALKVTPAAMACYVIYTGLDWPGLHTALHHLLHHRAGERRGHPAQGDPASGRLLCGRSARF